MKRVIVMATLLAGSVMAAPAMATNFTLSSTDASSGTSWFVAPQVSNGGYVWVADGPNGNGHLDVLSQAFDHTLTFNVAADSLIAVNLWQSEYGITFDNIFLNGVALSSDLTPGIGSMPGFSIGSAYAAAGDVSLRFVGTNYGNPHSFGGTLNIDAAPIPTAPAAVPEPATWALMIAGMALVGTSLRRRKTNVSFA